MKTRGIGGPTERLVPGELSHGLYQVCQQEIML